MSLDAIGFTLPKPRDGLTNVGTLEEFDFPLLELWKDARGRRYLHSWFCADGDTERWLLFRIRDDDLYRYLLRRRTYREILLNGASETVFVLDYDRDFNLVRTALAFLEQLPVALLPSTDSYHDPALRPEPRERGAPIRVPAIARAPNEQIVPIDGTWDADRLARFPRWLRQVYATLHVLGVGETPAPGPYLSGMFRDYKLDGGRVVYKMFDQLIKALHPDNAFALLAISYSSPGVFKFKARDETFERLLACIERARENEADLRDLRKRLDNAIKADDEEDIDAASRKLATSLDVNCEYLSAVAGGVRPAAALMKSLHTRVLGLIRLQRDGHVLLGDDEGDDDVDDDVDDA